MTLVRIVRGGLRPPGSGAQGSLRFYGVTSSDVGRGKILANSSSFSANVGATDITVEWWMRTTSGNNAAAITAGDNYDVINGNILIDRDRNGQGRAWVVSLTAGRVTVGHNVDNLNRRTIRGTTDIRDSLWHHCAWTRDVTSGAQALYVDGVREVNESSGPTGSVAYPNGGTPASGFEFSDPYLVLGTEKHDVGALGYFGYLTDLRLSTSIIYTGASITVPTARLTGGASLYQMNEGSGTTLNDASGNSDGTLSIGGTGNGPTWEAASPYAS